MTRALIFDTETTGLPEKNTSIKQLDKWPHVIQLSFILIDTSNNKIIMNRNEYVKINKDVVISPISQEITGITSELLDTKGVQIQSLLHEFNRALDICDVIVGHNVSFDKRIMMVEYFRNKINNKFVKFYGRNTIKKNEYCTCKNSAYLFNNRYQKLENLYTSLFNEKATGLHDSMIDTIVTMRCYYKLAFDRDLFDTNPELLKYINNNNNNNNNNNE